MITQQCIIAFQKNQNSTYNVNFYLSPDVKEPKVLKSDKSWKEEMVMSQTGTCTYDRLLHDCEVQRKEAIRAVSNNMLRKMAAKRTEVMRKFWHEQELEYEKKAQERCDLEMKILEEWAADDEIAKIEQEKLDQKNKAHLDRMRNLLEKQLEHTKLLETLNSCYSHICEDYQIITTVVCSDEAIGIPIFQEFEPTFSHILTLINNVMENCRNGIISINEVNLAKSLESDMSETRHKLTEKIQNALNTNTKNIEVSRPIATKEIIPQVEENIQQNIPNPTKEPAKSNEYCSKKSLEKYCELLEYLNNYEQNYKSLLEDPNLKKYRFDCQKAVNTPVNAISPLSGSHVKDKFQKLSDLLNGNKVLIGDAYISAAQHPQGKAYCTDLLARKIVKQGELLVSSHPEAAFPIASVAVALWACFPEFGKLLCAHFYKNCPYLIPMMMPQVEGQSDVDFYKSRGYKYNNEGVIEKQDQFLKRISGIFKLFAAIWITKMPRCIDAQHPQNLSHAWRWFAAFVNLSSEIDISATLLCDFLTICGADFSKYYKKQFLKVLRYLVADYLEELGRIDNGGPKTRLDVFIQSYESNGRIAQPVGLLSENFW